MPTLTLFEHECSSGLDCGRPELQALEDLQQRLGVELVRPTFRHGRCELKANQYVGVFRVGDLTIQVLPKMYRVAPGSPPALAVRRATRNLLALLEGAGQAPAYQPGLGPLLSRKGDWFEVLTGLFAVQLREEWQRGPLRGYQPVEDEGPTLRGRWRLAEQMRRPGRDHIFAFDHDSFSSDNPVNRLLRLAVERLWQCTHDADNRRLLDELRQLMAEVTLLPQPETDPELPPAQAHLRPLLRLARLFLAGDTLQLAEGDLATFAVVFDMNRVFEGFLLQFFARYRRALLPLHLHDAELHPRAQGASLALAQAADQPVFHLRPDLVLRQGDRVPLIVDAKYRLLDEESVRLGVATADFYQMLAYARRYRCPRVVLLYPQTAGMDRPLERLFTLEGCRDTTILAATVDLRRNLSSTCGRKVLGRRLRAVMLIEG